MHKSKIECFRGIIHERIEICKPFFAVNRITILVVLLAALLDHAISISADIEFAAVAGATCLWFIASEGMSITFISSETDEMLRTCSRLLVMRDRKLVGELTGDQLTQNTIMNTIAGGERNDG